MPSTGVPTFGRPTLWRREFRRREFLRTAGGLAAATGLATVAGCGSNTGRTSAGGLNQWYHQYGEDGTLQAAKKFAAAYQESDVKVTWTPGDYANKIASGLLSSAAPDVFEWWFSVDLVKSGQAAPLDDILTDVKHDFTAEDLRINSYQGKVYGIRMIDDPQVLFYRKSLLANAGVKPPTTFDELIDAVKKLSTGGMKGVYFGSQNFILDLHLRMIWAAGVDIVGTDHTSHLTDERVVAAVTKARELFTSGGMLVSAPTEWTDPSAFNQGLVAMQWCGMWALPEIQKKHPGDFGVLPLPKIGAAGRPVVYNGGWTQFVNAKGKNVEAAKKYVKWLWIEQTKYQEEWSLNYGFHIPPRKSVAAKATKLQSGPAAEVVKIARRYGVGDNPAYTPKMNTAVTDAVNRIVRSGAPVKPALAAADKVVQAELRRLFG